jgi:hypothetical protein
VQPKGWWQMKLTESQSRELLQKHGVYGGGKWTS